MSWKPVTALLALGNLQCMAVAATVNALGPLSMTAENMAALISGQCTFPPRGCPSDLIGFYFYDARNDGLQLHLEDDRGITEAPFRADVPVKFIVHGYSGGRNNPGMIQLRAAYFQNQTVNIVVLDWSTLAKSGCYYTAFQSTPVVGRCGAKFVSSLLRLRPDIQVDQIHVIGFSLGAQASANMADLLRRSDIVFRRLTALDPAFPLFYPPVVSADDIVSRRHARFVDAYHTNAGMFGVSSSHAHIDVYANGGNIQPGCEATDPVCSHKRALDYYTESIYSSVGFHGRKCRNDPALLLGRCDESPSSRAILVGEYIQPVQSRNEGAYGFRTNSKAPFAISPESNR